MKTSLLLILVCSLTWNVYGQENGYNDWFPAWSPDGKQVIFGSDRSGDNEIYIANRDGSALKRLTNSPGRDAHPSWSPDGKTIVFQSPRAGESAREVEIYIMNINGGNLQKITDNKGFSGVPVFSPDGKEVLFQVKVVPDGKEWGEVNWHLRLISADGSRQRALTDGMANDQVANWSPDGQQIVFFSDRTGNNDIFVMDATGDNVNQLTDHPGDDIVACWFPDGKKIAFCSNRDGSYDVYILTMASGSLERITNNGSGNSVPFVNGNGEIILNFAENEQRRIGFLQFNDGAYQTKKLEIVED